MNAHVRICVYLYIIRLELFRSMDTYTNVVDLKYIKGIFEQTGVQFVDKSTLKFTGFLVDSHISRM